VDRHADAVWEGDLKSGHGRVSTGSGGLSDAAYNFASRFERGGATDPEELIAAAHAGCFSMAFSGQLAEAGITATSIHTTATVTLEKTDAGPTITRSNLKTTVRAAGAAEDQVRQAAENARKGCPVSRLLGTEITLELTIA
jgi:lipoyl-dependent peroxiredoxin